MPISTTWVASYIMPVMNYPASEQLTILGK